MEKIEAVLISAGIVWGAYSIIIKAFQLLNEKRDTILMNNDIDRDYKKLMFYSDFIPMQAGVVVFLLILTFILTQIPHFIQNPTPGKDIFYIAYSLAILPAMAIVGYIVGGVQDISTIVSKLELKKNDKKSVKSISSFRRYLKRMNALMIFMTYIILALTVTIILVLYRIGIINFSIPE